MTTLAQQKERNGGLRGTCGLVCALWRLDSKRNLGYTTIPARASFNHAQPKEATKGR